MSNLTQGDKKISVLAVLGSGGHTTEMLKMVEGLDRNHYSKTFVHANTDTMSARKLLTLLPQDFQVRLLFQLIFKLFLPFNSSGLPDTKSSRSWPELVVLAFLHSLGLLTKYSCGFKMST